jgi:prevent-host-death family protein
MIDDPRAKTVNGLYSVRHPREAETMRYSTQVKSISYLKANAAEVLDRLRKDREPMVITQNGEAQAVIQDVASYESTQETLAFLKLLALGNADIEGARTRPLVDAVNALRARSTARDET